MFKKRTERELTISHVDGPRTCPVLPSLNCKYSSFSGVQEAPDGGLGGVGGRVGGLTGGSDSVAQFSGQ